MTDMKKIEQLRAEIELLHDERDALLKRRLNQDAVGAKVAAIVAGWHAAAMRKNKRDLQLLEAGDHARLLDLHDPNDIGPIATLLLGREEVEDRLLEMIECVRVGVSPEERAERLAAIGRELDLLEAEEEALIEQLEFDGQVVFRRANARPEIVLGTK